MDGAVVLQSLRWPDGHLSWQAMAFGEYGRAHYRAVRGIDQRLSADHQRINSPTLPFTIAAWLIRIPRLQGLCRVFAAEQPQVLAQSRLCPMRL
jgi:hypothetical protein